VYADAGSGLVKGGRGGLLISFSPVPSTRSVSGLLFEYFPAIGLALGVE
jgi:hypothetical protein